MQMGISDGKLIIEPTSHLVERSSRLTVKLPDAGASPTAAFIQMRSSSRRHFFLKYRRRPRKINVY